jgi:dihydroorotase-like cyclic amidohydrolase
MNNMADLYLKNAEIVTETETFRGGVVVEGEKIVQIVEGLPTYRSRADY